MQLTLPERIDGTGYTLWQAGISDKYGQVYVERRPDRAFDDPEEPVALFRAADQFTLEVLARYVALLLATKEGIPEAQLLSVYHQIRNFVAWREAHPEKVRLPGG